MLPHQSSQNLVLLLNLLLELPDTLLIMARFRRTRLSTKAIGALHKQLLDWRQSKLPDATVSALPAGRVDKNPLYGSHPSAGRLYGTNMAACAVPFLLSQRWKHRHPEAADALNRGVFVAALTGGGVHLGAGLGNEGVLSEQQQLRIH